MPDLTAETMRLKVLLRKEGHFVTQARLRLFTVLQEDNELTIPELISLLNRHDQATVYRNIKVFESLGIINRLQLGLHSKLELSDVFQHHHHHLSCVKCSKVIPLPENKELETIIKRASQQRNFKAMDHQLEIRGVCQKCRKS